ncbi:MAG: radical SAM family heme chaperone HemW [Gemmatimonadaceae bacterium]
MRHVYLHVPFCARRCSYCDFSIAVRRDVPVDEYLGALSAELRTRYDGQQFEVDTIYLGGGTPSRLGGEGVARALDLLRRHFRPVSDAEITIEANPEDVSPAAADAWRVAGVNRLSLGGQTFDDRVLTWMHRGHGAAGTAEAVATARAAGIANLSLDLIFALPESLERNWLTDVRRVLELEPDHISLYGLTIEPSTPLGKWVAAGATVEQPEEGYVADFMLAHDQLTRAGFDHYEVSNYALAGRRARHNSAYWNHSAYAGLGPAAHAFDGRTRRWNSRAYAAWRDIALSGVDPIEGSEELTADNRVAEDVYLGLRSDAGLLVTPADDVAVRPWIDAGWAALGTDGRLRCTAQGWLRLDALAAALTHHRSR